MHRYLIALLMLAAIAPALAQSSRHDPLSAYLSALPSKPTVVESAPQSYRLITNYFTFDSAGNLTGKERVSGDYTRGLPGGTVRWNNVLISHASGLTDPFPAGATRAYMDGFTYKLSDFGKSFQPSFFAGFPDEMETKSMVWDVGMFEVFARYFLGNLKLNTPYPLTLPDTIFPGGGSFHNRRPELTWVGISKQDGKTCAVIQYEALFNNLNFTTNGVPVKGTSSYWGTIWVRLDTLTIEYGTLREDVLANVVVPSANGKQTLIINTIRKATFARIASGDVQTTQP